MPWTIPDKGEGDNDIQSILYQEYLDVLVEGVRGLTCVVSGCEVTGGADMTPEVAKGAVLSNGTLYAVAANTVTIGAADATNPRIDLVVVNSSGSLAVRAGTAAAQPKPPARTANDVVLAAVYVPANDTAIATTQITDMRVIRDSNVVLKKTTSAVTFNTTAAQQTYASIVLPSGLFLAGKVCRLRCGGNMRLNNTTPTVRIVMTYGGTTLISDISGVSTNDTDRSVWSVMADLVAITDSTQVLNAMMSTGIIAAKTAPTTGLGDAWSTAQNVGAMRGTASVNSDAGDRTFDLRFTMSVSNASNEIVCDYATFELL